MVTTSRRAGRVTNKTKLLIHRGSDKVDLGNAEIIVWEHDSTSGAEATKHQHVGAKGVESGELLVSRVSSFTSMHFRGDFIMVITTKRRVKDGWVGRKEGVFRLFG